MGTRLKVIFVIGSLDVGGTERQLVLLAAHLRARGHVVQVFALDASGSLRGELCALGVEVVDGGCRTSASFVTKLLRMTRALGRLWWTMLRGRPRVAHAFLPMAGLLAVVAGRLAGVPRIVVSRRALGTHQDRHPYWRRIDRIVALLANVVTANSVAVARDTAARDGVPLEKIVVIPNGIDVKPFEAAGCERERVRRQLGLQDEQIAIACVGNLIPYKGHLDLVEAFVAVTQVEPRCRLFLIGADRGQGAVLAKRIESLGVAPSVVALGFRPDVVSLLAAMDLGVSASHEEGLSNALLEYLAAGLAVVATDVGGSAEVVGDIPGCRLVPARDPRALADAIVTAVREKRDPASKAARRAAVAVRFAPDAMVAGYLRVYAGVGRSEEDGARQHGFDSLP